MKVLEPCCYVKLLNQWIGEDGDVSLLYHNGDVFLQQLLQWMLRYAVRYPGLRVTLALPSVTPDLLDTIRAVRYSTAYDSSRNSNYGIISNLSLITRSVDVIADYLDMFDTVAITRNLSMQAVTITNGTEHDGCHLTLTGGLVQAVSPGLHLIVITKTRDKYNLVQPLLDSHLRLHRFVIRNS